ncbi:hypothetical protein BGZ76_000377 [Entomortierella beljakovae]|nr:hypothetical protein BGZ76_000377 [Entomortierella beljakovae]
MIFEQNVHVIVCLTGVSHDRLNRGPKAERYWPMAGKTDELDKDLFVKNIDSVDGQDKVAYRHLEIWNPIDTVTAKRSVLLVHYQGWPDHGVPSKSNDLRDIFYKIREWKLEQAVGQDGLMDFGPTVVHCSAGCGRTGTFCVIDTVLSILEYVKYPNLAPSPSGYNPYGENGQSVDPTPQGQQGDKYDWESDRDIIYESLDSFRKERMLMVQTPVQYNFCYDTVRDLCQ